MYCVMVSMGHREARLIITMVQLLHVKIIALVNLSDESSMLLDNMEKDIQIAIEVYDITAYAQIIQYQKYIATQIDIKKKSL